MTCEQCDRKYIQGYQDGGFQCLKMMLEQLNHVLSAPDLKEFIELTINKMREISTRDLDHPCAH